MDCIVRGVAKGQTQLSDCHFHNKEILRQCPALGASKDAEKDREKKRQVEGRLKEQQEKEGKVGESKGQEEEGKSPKCKKQLHEVLG